MGFVLLEVLYFVRGKSNEPVHIYNMTFLCFMCRDLRADYFQITGDFSESYIFFLTFSF